MGDYEEIAQWVAEGRVDCGFTRLPSAPGLETIFLEQDAYMAVLPEDHPKAGAETFPAEDFEKEPFLLLEHGKKEEVSEYLEQHGIVPKIHFTTWDDYAIMSMVENGLGISILPELILRKAPYRIRTLPLSEPLVRNIGLILKDKRTASSAVKMFLRYLEYR